MKTIIVPFDFSVEAEAGLNLALILAEKTDANIQLVNVIPKNESSDSAIVEKQHEAASRKFEDILRKNKGKLKPNFELTYAVKEGKIFREIASLSDSFEDVLTVLSTHGESGVDDLFIGGNAYKIVSHSKNPVITVRSSKKILSFDKIVMPLDITFQTREKVPYTAKLAKLFNSKLHILTVTTTEDESIVKKLREYSEQVISYVKYHKIPFSVEHLTGDNITDITLEYANKIDANLISIMSEQEKSLSNLLLGSYAHQMINKSLIPVLTFPNYQIRIVADDIWSLGEFNER